MAASKLLAQGSLSGHEARATVTIVRGADGTVVLTLADLWIAPGAPDVRIYLGTNPEGRVDDSALDLGKPPSEYGQTSIPLPPAALNTKWGSVIVYCKVYSVLFGFARLLWSHEKPETNSSG